MDKVLMSATGVNGQIELLGNRVRIRRKGLLGVLTHGLAGDREILISQISSIQFKQAGMLANGYIQFAFLGGGEAKGALLQATTDENTVVFNVWQKKQFEDIKSAIDDRIAACQSRGREQDTTGIDDLEKLASLRDRGIITQEEFAAKKKQILGL